MNTKYIYLTKCYLNNRKFNVYLNPTTEKKLFLEFKDNGLAMPTSEDLYYLDSIYNLDPYIMFNIFSKKGKTKKNNDFMTPINSKEYIKNKTSKFICIYLASTVYINIVTPLFLDNYNTVHNVEEIYYIAATNVSDVIFHKKPIEQIDTEDFYDNIKTSIEENENINDQIKDALVDNENINYLKSVVDNYGKYMEQDNVISKMRNLKLSYKDQCDEKFLEEKSTFSGLYQIAKNQIYLLKSESNKEFDEYQYGVLFHETDHATESIWGPEYLGRGIREAIAEQLRIKFYNNGYDTYSDERNHTTMLYMLVGSDSLLRFYYRGDVVNLISSLTEIYGTTSDAVRLISLIDTINNTGYAIARANRDIEKGKDTIDARNLDNYLRTKESAINEFNNLYSKYYEAKFNKPLSESLYFHYLQNNHNNVIPELSEVEAYLSTTFRGLNYGKEDDISSLFPKYIAFDCTYWDGYDQYITVNAIIDITSDTIKYPNEEFQYSKIETIHRKYAQNKEQYNDEQNKTY